MEASRAVGTGQQAGRPRLRGAAVFLFWFHSGNRRGDLGPVTSPWHCCQPICEPKGPAPAMQALPGQGRLMRRSLQRVWRAGPGKAERCTCKWGPSTRIVTYIVSHTPDTLIHEHKLIRIFTQTLIHTMIYNLTHTFTHIFTNTHYHLP